MIHQYKNNGYNIVLDVNSGSVHVVDDLVYDAIAYMVDNQLEKADQSVAYEALKENFSDRNLSEIKDLFEIVEEIYELKDKGMLFT
ncbi:MAG: thioether cross-link-forming SCIFF peptide maturase, partial [Lachnospiraceae bacterium]|nr:thioether cross-link-forming SCIFF peptide maturase [Lachnospiraceae bacterium]